MKVCGVFVLFCSFALVAVLRFDVSHSFDS